MAFIHAAIELAVPYGICIAHGGPMNAPAPLSHPGAMPFLALCSSGALCIAPHAMTTFT
jgi:hypothetical protein